MLNSDEAFVLAFEYWKQKESAHHLPPEDSEDVSDQEDKADKGREAVRVTRLFHDFVALNYIPYARPQDHT